MRTRAVGSMVLVLVILISTVVAAAPARQQDVQSHLPPIDLPAIPMSLEEYQRVQQYAPVHVLTLLPGESLDVCIGGTSAAVSYLGSERALQMAINQAVVQANVAFQASGDNDYSFRLMPVNLTSYQEPVGTSGAVDIEAVLRDLKAGRVQGMHQLREDFGCDLLGLIVFDKVAFNACGIAFLMQEHTLGWGFRDAAVSVTDVRCLPTNTMAHEIGHNLGMQHQIGHTGGVEGISPDAHGYEWKEGGVTYNTIMAVRGVDTTYWSSTTATSQSGYPLGVPGQADVNSAFNAAFLVARLWRARVVPNGKYAWVDEGSLQVHSPTLKTVSGGVLVPWASVEVSLDGGVTWVDTTVEDTLWRVRMVIPEDPEIVFRVNGYEFNYSFTPTERKTYLPIVFGSQ